MKFSAAVFSMLALDAAAVTIKETRTLRMMNGGGGRGSNKGKSGGSGGFQPNTRFQSFTPAYMFAIGVDTSSGLWAYVADEGAFIYQVETLFGDGEEDNSHCNNIGCFQEYFTFATKGKKKNANQWSVTVATSIISSSFHWVCPLPQMIPSATGFCQNEASSPGFPATTPTTITLNSVQGPTVDGMSASPGCSDYLVELICTGTTEEIELIESYDPSDSPGFDGRPYTDAALMMTANNGKTFWSADPTVTSFELVDFDKDGDANACNTFACNDAYDTVVYLRGPDPLYAEIQSIEGFSSSYKFMCPGTDHTIVLTPLCNGVITTWSSTPDYHGPYAESGSISCTGTEGLNIRCIDPTPEESTGKNGKNGKNGKSRRLD